MGDNMRRCKECAYPFMVGGDGADRDLRGAPKFCSELCKNRYHQQTRNKAGAELIRRHRAEFNEILAALRKQRA